MRRLALVLLAASFGCAVAPGYMGPDDIATATTAARHRYGGFSISPPRTAGWRVRVSEQRPEAGVFRRELASPTHTFIAGAELIELASGVPFEQAATPRGLDDPARHEVLENAHEAYAGRFGPCLRYTIRLADKGAPNAGGAVLHFLERGIVCAHPTMSGTAVRASFSERGLPDELDPSLWTELEAYLESLELERVPGVAADS
jgi:hypothetical protein